MTTITSFKGTITVATAEAALAYLTEYQPAGVEIAGEDIAPAGAMWGDDEAADLAMIAAASAASVAALTAE